jgi:hypothetical protein
MMMALSVDFKTLKFKSGKCRILCIEPAAPANQDSKRKKEKNTRISREDKNIQGKPSQETRCFLQIPSPPFFATFLLDHAGSKIVVLGLGLGSRGLAASLSWDEEAGHDRAYGQGNVCCCRRA